MPDPIRAHNCRPLWVAGSPPVATCNEHYGQPAGITAKLTAATR